MMRLTAVAIIVIMLLNLAYGAWRLNQRDVLSPGPRVLAIQTNLPQDNKIGWSAEDQARDLPRFIDLTRRALAATTPAPDLIVWPETMVPGLGFDSQTLDELHTLTTQFSWDLSHLSRWPTMLLDLQRELGIPMLLGSGAWVNVHERIEGDKVTLVREKEFNSAYLINQTLPSSSHDPNAPSQPAIAIASVQRYDKAVLTPFGETMPYISNWPWLERQLLTLGAPGMSFALDASTDMRLLMLQSSAGPCYTIAAPICFEDTAAPYLRRMVHQAWRQRKLQERMGQEQAGHEWGVGADAIINISNDGWFGVSDADRVLHGQIARFRCIENRVPMVRCVNTGVSAAFDSCGRLIRSVDGNKAGASQPPRQEGWIAAQLMLDSRRTLYGRVGEVWPWACLASTLAMMIGSMFCSRNRKNAP